MKVTVEEVTKGLAAFAAARDTEAHLTPGTWFQTNDDGTCLVCALTAVLAARYDYAVALDTVTRARPEMSRLNTIAVLLDVSPAYVSGFLTGFDGDRQDIDPLDLGTDYAAGYLDGRAIADSDGGAPNG